MERKDAFLGAGRDQTGGGGGGGVGGSVSARDMGLSVGLRIRSGLEVGFVGLGVVASCHSVVLKHERDLRGVR